MNLYKSIKLKVPDGRGYLFINAVEGKGGRDSMTYLGTTRDNDGLNINYAGRILVKHELALGVNEHSCVDVKVGDTWLK